VAVNKNSDLSRKELNAKLQERLNPNQKVNGTPFRVKDKVVCLANGFYPCVESSTEIYVANGSLGEVKAIEDKRIKIKIGKTSVYAYRGKASKESTGTNWDLGYALSVHKFQGSEQKHVIVMLDSSGAARRVCDRAWIYTAISRAAEHCYLIGTPQTAERFCRVQKIDGRNTFLAERLHQKQAELNQALTEELVI
ncbi:MAG: ATP-dependent RecD-like DNA helicase, partial [Planctomycetota bacterium]